MVRKAERLQFRWLAPIKIEIYLNGFKLKTQTESDSSRISLVIRWVLFSIFLFFFFLELWLPFFWRQPPPNFSQILYTERDGYKFLISGAHGINYGREFFVEVAGNEFGYREGTWPNKIIPGKVRSLKIFASDSTCLPGPRVLAFVTASLTMLALISTPSFLISGLFI